MAYFLKALQVVLIIFVTLTINRLIRVYAAPRNEQKPNAGALWNRSSMVIDVTQTKMTSSEDGSTVVSDGSGKSMEQQFLRRLGMKAPPWRRSKRSKAPTVDAIPGYLTEIYQTFQRQARRNWNAREEPTVTGVLPYRVSSVNSKMVNVYFYLKDVLKFELIGLAEVVVMQTQAATPGERDGRISLRSLRICREAEANDSCRVVGHKPFTRRHHFDIYDIARSLQELRTELSMSPNDGSCVGCSLIVTLVHRGSKELIPSISADEVLLVASNRPITDPVWNEDSTGSERRKTRRFDRTEARRSTTEDLKTAIDLRGTSNKDNRRQRREVTCSLSSWYLDFAKLGWTSWIRYPLGYYANYCSGSCVSPLPTSPGGNMTNHAFVKGLYRTALQNESPVPQASIDALPTACCVPVRLSPINILYRNDDDNWIIRGMSEMVADQCGCL